MLIEEKIKELQRLKAKIDLYKTLEANVQNELKSLDKEHRSLESEFPGLLEEFCKEINVFCSKRIEQLGNGDQSKLKLQPAEPAPENQKIEKPQQKVPIQEVDGEPADPLRFLMKHKGLDGKRVSFLSKDGEVQGTVRGLITPFIKVETDSGFVIDVSPKELKVI